MSKCSYNQFMTNERKGHVQYKVLGREKRPNSSLINRLDISSDHYSEWCETVNEWACEKHEGLPLSSIMGATKASNFYSSEDSDAADRFHGQNDNSYFTQAGQCPCG